MSSYFKSFKRRNAEQDVQSELRFHLDLLTEANIRAGMSVKDAREAALKRFGSLERVKNQCVEISERRNLPIRILKFFLVIIFLSGVLARIFGSDVYDKQIGNMLMAIAALSGLLLYIRGLRHLSFAPANIDPSPLGIDGAEDADCQYHVRLSRG